MGKNGKGREYEDGKEVFIGEYLNGKKHGKGEEIDTEGYIKENMKMEKD